MYIAVVLVRQSLKSSVPDFLALANVRHRHATKSKLSLFVCLLVCERYFVVVTNLMSIKVHKAAKDLDTNCGLLNSRIVFATLYRKTYCNKTTVATSNAASFGTATALVSFLYWIVTAFLKKLFYHVWVRGPRMSVARNPSVPFGRN